MAAFAELSEVDRVVIVEPHDDDAFLSMGWNMLTGLANVHKTVVTCSYSPNINDKGEFFGEQDSLVTDFLQQEFLRKNLTEGK